VREKSEIIKLIETRSHSKLRAQQEEEDILPQVLQLMEDEDSQVRANAAFACAQLAADFPQDVEQAIPKLTNLLDDKDKDVIQNACSALGESGRLAPEIAKNAIPSLIRLLSDSEVQRMASFAIGKIGGEIPQDVERAVPKLGELLDSDDPHVRFEACEALARISEKWPEGVRSLVPRFVKLTDDWPRDSAERDLPGICGDAVKALGRIGRKYPEDVKEWIPRLAYLSKDEEHNISENAIEALRAIEKEHPEVVSQARDEMESMLKEAKRTILWSWVMAAVFGAIALFVISQGGEDVSLLDKIVFFLAGIYVPWSWYWGRTFILDRWGDKLAKYTAGERGWILGWVLILFVFPTVGFCGGGIYEYVQYRRVARLAEDRTSAGSDTGTLE